MSSLVNWGFTAIFIATSSGLCFAADNKLIATVADINGRCMVETSWIDVSGRYIYWEVSGPSVRTNWHKSDLVSPKEGDPSKVAAESSILRTPFAFALNLSNARINSPYFDLAFPDLAYRDAMRIKMKMPNLVGAVMVHQVKEHDLWKRNVTNGSNIFSGDNLNRSFYVPTRYSVCDLDIRYLMNKAEAVFEKPFVGKVVIRSNQTVPFKPGERSFAEEILDRRD